MKLSTITTQNRGAARKMLSAWHPSKIVRTWSLHDLRVHLQRAISSDLLTAASANRALSGNSEAPPTGDIGEQEYGNDDEQNEGGDSGSDSGSDSGDEQGEQGDSEQSEQGEQQQGESDSGDDSESEQEKETEQEKEQREKDEQAAQEKKDDPYKTDDSEDIRHEMLDVIKMYITANIPVMLIGPTGCGKSFLAEQAAGELDMPYFCTGSVFAKYDLIGYVNQVTDKYHGTPAFEAHTKGGLYCQDEMDASNAAALVAFNALNDKQTHFTWPCGTMPKHSGYRAIGTANTWCNGATADYVGRNKLDGATVNRFVRVYIDYDKRVERRIGSLDICNRVWAIRDACAELGIRHILSTRSIDYAETSRKAGLTCALIDRDILFAGLDDETITQIKSSMKGAV